MRYDHSAAGRQLTLLLNDVEVPTDEADRTQFLDALETAIADVFADHGVDPAGFRAIGGHTYAAIEDQCPACSEDLRLVEPALDPHNGARARAQCDCGWSGEAVYRLIDLQESNASDGTDSDADDSKSEPVWLDKRSSVSRHDLDPGYYPY